MRKRNFRFLFSLALLVVGLSLPTALWAQADGDQADSVATDTTVVPDTLPEVRIDTLIYQPIRNVPPAEQVTNLVDFEQHMYQNPTVALFKSMLVPGLGQLGNHKYFKTALIAGLEGWLISTGISRGRDAADARDAYLAATDIPLRLSLYNKYDTLRRSRNKHYWFAGLVTFLSMFDAYVDAHLSGSPADSHNDNISLDIAPTQDGGVAAQLSLSF